MSGHGAKYFTYQKGEIHELTELKFQFKVRVPYCVVWFISLFGSSRCLVPVVAGFLMSALFSPLEPAH